MVDKVKPMGIENAATGGTEDFDFPTEMNPAEDYAAVKGIAFENNDDILIYKNVDGDLGFIDENQATFIPFYFGAFYQYEESLTTSSTSSTTFQNKLSLVTPTLPIGSYRINWTAILSHDTASRQSESQVTLDASEIWLIKNEGARVLSEYANTAFHHVTFGSAATHTIDLNYRRSSGSSATVTIKEARIEIWRVD